ncbi:hypothetical protein BKA62DRAFT_44004 [Auriculariales sp. MPI-PUGE-AT-0066]|nr:hypothetical protein BKA62DRAFT_44004 [Auriculariales sp. MPI-PUGE-AT-0066]
MGTTGSLLVLPIWDDVLDELALNRASPTIAALSLTCRSLRLPSQRALFRSLTFTGRLYSGKPGTSREVIENLRSDSNSRLRGYVRRVTLCSWLPTRSWVYANEAYQEPEESKQLKLTLQEVLLLLEHLPHLLSLRLFNVLLETHTLERLSAKLLNLTNVEVGYCEWSSDNPPEDAMSVTPHAVKDVRIRYCVPSGGCTSPGGRIQIPAILHMARALIQPGQIERLFMLAYYGMEELILQLVSSKSHFPRLVSLALICPPASSSSDIILLLRRCPALEELIIDRRDYPNRRVQWRGPDQKDERDSIASNSRAFEAVTFVPNGFLPALKAFTGSLDEAVAILKLPERRVERLEVHRTFQCPTHEPLPKEAIDELMDALEMTSLESRNHVLELKCIDLRWDEHEWWSTHDAEQDAARKVSKAPQRARTVFPNLQTFAYSGPIVHTDSE